MSLGCTHSCREGSVAITQLCQDYNPPMTRRLYVLNMPGLSWHPNHAKTTLQPTRAKTLHSNYARTKFTPQPRHDYITTHWVLYNPPMTRRLYVLNIPGLSRHPNHARTLYSPPVPRLYILTMQGLNSHLNYATTTLQPIEFFTT